MALITIQGLEDEGRGIHYVLDPTLDPIGVGGMGQVFRGFRVDEKTGVEIPAAIKFLFDDLPPNAIERSRREASIQIDNENLLKMFGFFEVDEKVPGGFIPHYHVASELLYGVKLSDMLEGVTTGPDGLPIEKAEEWYRLYKEQPRDFATTIVKAVLSGIMAFHDKGYIHRDIDPSNVMLTADGKIKVIDFGIAKMLSEMKGQGAHLTTAGQFMGKAAYAAPELALGDIAHQNETTDIYAIGVMLYQLLTGHLPFDGSTQEILDKQVHAPIPLAEIKDKSLKSIISKALAKKQADRYHSAAEFRVDIEKAMREGPKKGLSIPKPAIYGACGAVILAVILAVTLSGPKEKKPTREVPAEEVVVAEVVRSAAEYTEEAVTMLRGGSFDKGVEALTKAMDKDSTSSAKAYAIMASLYSHDGACKTLGLRSNFGEDFGKAFELSKKAVALDKNCYYALYELAESYGKRYESIVGVERDVPKAIEYAKACLSLATANNDSALAAICKEEFHLEDNE
ncbi:MAG: serine/threonine protein kinase [Bacteroidales bacterium]|nr:serine/threonine protein kinase [Bacteroidales bacterium]